MSERESTYNGWTNYPTWNVHLWLSNDESLYHAAIERTRAAYEANESKSDVIDALRGWVRDELAPDLGASFAADLLGYALDEVDWVEIADAWIETATEGGTE
jgi:hypothetical protein